MNEQINGPMVVVKLLLQTTYHDDDDVDDGTHLTAKMHGIHTFRHPKFLGK